MTDQTSSGSPDDPTRLREEAEEEIQALSEKASDEEVERMAERDRIGLDEPDGGREGEGSDEVNQNSR